MLIDTLGLAEIIQGRKASEEGTHAPELEFRPFYRRHDCSFLECGHVCWVAGARVGP